MSIPLLIAFLLFFKILPPPKSTLFPYTTLFRSAAEAIRRILVEAAAVLAGLLAAGGLEDRKSTRLNSSHSQISYAVFCLKKKNEPGSRFVAPTRNSTRGSREKVASQR